MLHNKFGDSKPSSGTFPKSFSNAWRIANWTCLNRFSLFSEEPTRTDIITTASSANAKIVFLITWKLRNYFHARRPFLPKMVYRKRKYFLHLRRPYPAIDDPTRKIVTQITALKSLCLCLSNKRGNQVLIPSEIIYQFARDVGDR